MSKMVKYFCTREKLDYLQIEKLKGLETILFMFGYNVRESISLTNLIISYNHKVMFSITKEDNTYTILKNSTNTKTLYYVLNPFKEKLSVDELIDAILQFLN
ncbi:hypothetical protein D3C76_03660 [compost metagenome]